MSVFNTKRQNPDEKLNEMIALAATRRKKYNSVLEASAESEKAAQLKKELDAEDEKTAKEKEKTDSLNNMVDRRIEERKNSSLAAMESRLINKGFDTVYNQIIFEMAYKAMWIDDEAKTSDNIHSMYETFLEIKNELDKTIPVATTESLLIRSLKNDVMSVVKKAAHRIVTEAKSCKEVSSCKELDEIDFNLNKEEDDELTDLTKLTSDQIASKVKDKVLAVVQDEEKNGKEKADMFKEMDDAIKSITNDETNTNTQTDAESVPDDTEETSEPEETPAEEPAVKESFEAHKTRAIRNRFNRNTRSSLFESIMMFNAKDIRNQAVRENLSITNESISNATLLSSIVHYTILETFNTLKLYDLTNPRNAEKVINMYK